MSFGCKVRAAGMASFANVPDQGRDDACPERKDGDQRSRALRRGGFAAAEDFRTAAAMLAVSFVMPRYAVCLMRRFTCL